MKKKILLIPIFFICLSAFAQNKENSNELVYTDDLITGTWILKEIKFINPSVNQREVIVTQPSEPSSSYDIKSDDKQNSDGNSQTLNRNSNTNDPVEKSSGTGEGTKVSRENNEYQKLLTSNDSVIFRYHEGLPEDSIFRFIIYPDKKFISGTTVYQQNGEWKLDGSSFWIFVNDHTVIMKIYVLNETELVIENTGDKEIYRMFLEK